MLAHVGVGRTRNGSHRRAGAVAPVMFTEEDMESGVDSKVMFEAIAVVVAALAAGGAICWTLIQALG